MAGELSGDTQIFDDVLSGKDVHRQTASIIFQKEPAEVTKLERQDAKEFTFAPIFGGMGMAYAPHIRAYFQKFFEIYAGVKNWHDHLQNEAVRTGKVRTFTGREYAFPYAKRNKWGSVSQSTQIKNWPVQGTATGDVVPCAFIALSRAMRKAGLQSLPINTVHDSIVVDVYPGEEDACIDLMRKIMSNVNQEVERRYNYVMRMPLAIEMKLGDNWLDGKEFK